MKSIRQHRLWPVRHDDFEEVGWDDSYDFAVRCFGGVPNSDADTILRPGRCFLPAEMEENLKPTSRNEFYWRKFKSIDKNAANTFKAIDREHVRLLISGVPNINMDWLIMMYEINKNKH